MFKFKKILGDNKCQNGAGYTLIEIIVVIAIIGFIVATAMYAFNYSRARARDAKRMADIQTIKKAIELFYDENDRFPDNANDGISDSGEFFGVGNGIDIKLGPFLQNVPQDPRHDGNIYFYAYDPSHLGCEPVLSINNFETTAAENEFSHQDTTQGGQMNINSADYNSCFYE